MLSRALLSVRYQNYVIAMNYYVKVLKAARRNNVLQKL